MTDGTRFVNPLEALRAEVAATSERMARKRYSWFVDLA